MTNYLRTLRLHRYNLLEQYDGFADLENRKHARMCRLVAYLVSSVELIGSVA